MNIFREVDMLENEWGRFIQKEIYFLVKVRRVKLFFVYFPVKYILILR